MEKELKQLPYYNRLVAYPYGGEKLNQLDLAVQKIARDPITRRAIVSTRVPEIDLNRREPNYMEELQLRAYVDSNGIVLNMYTNWSDLDLDDHFNQMRYLHEKLAHDISRLTGTSVRVGSYFQEVMGNPGFEVVNGDIPSVVVSAENISEAHWRLLSEINNKGFPLRTQYDRKDSAGNFIDPAGRDTRALVFISRILNEPRFCPTSFSERGKYIAEMLGVKDHFVLSYQDLIKLAQNGEHIKNATQWPYTYPQRLSAYPRGYKKINQLEIMTDILAEDLSSTRAVATTRVPEIDLFLKEDLPCLGQIQFLAEENNGKILLNSILRWRSRDGFKAWADNLAGISVLLQRQASRLSEKTGKEVELGWYKESNGSLHTYGQAYIDKSGLDVLFDRFPTAESYVNRGWDLVTARDYLLVPELKSLRGEATWRFPKESIETIDRLIQDLESGRIK